jgi:putative ubiquitin-RnfH superfamily antitoxin RatB of RatAB toxin-antitoxin module
MRITVVYSPAPRVVHEWTQLLPVGASVNDALSACAQDARFPKEHAMLSVGVWGKKVRLDHALNDADRVELCRPLRVDPKVARRERFKKQGAKSAGLFAQRRPGAKAGY